MITFKQTVWETQMALHFSRPSGSRVIDQIMENNILINNSRTIQPIKISNVFFEFLRQCASDAYTCIMFQKSVGNFEIAHKTCFLM